MLTNTQQTELTLQYVRAHLPIQPIDATFDARLTHYFSALMRELNAVYGARDDFLSFLIELISAAQRSDAARPAELKAQDAAREAQPDWFTSNQMVGGVCYVDLFAGNLQGMVANIPYFQELGLNYIHLMPLFQCPAGQSDGGYAVSSYREVNPQLGTIDDLAAVAAAFKAAGIVLVVDFIFNHTSNEHLWARESLAGNPTYADFYYIYPNREVPDAFDATVREIFPDQHPGAFSQLPDGRWVWTTFNSFQWDLNYSNPAVFTAMAQEMLFIANLGVDILRMDAVAFIWKQLGTDCENLPQAHALIRAFNVVARIAAPSLLFKSEAIVHPDQVIEYIAPNECQLSYNPLQMALLWNSLATREVGLLQQALTRRHSLPPNTAWVNYVRCHDDIGWTFADEDAAELGINGFTHRQFLNHFYVNRFEGSFARGVPFQDNAVTGDCRISGMCASLTGLEQGDAHAIARIVLLYSVILSTGGLPLIYLGDEVGMLNDYDFVTHPDKAVDSRWVHRPAINAARYAQRDDVHSDAGKIFTELQHMIAVRKATPALSGNALTSFETHNPHVLGYMRNDAILVLCNFSEFSQTVDAQTLSAMPMEMRDVLTGLHVDVWNGLELGAYQVRWLVIGLQ